MIFNHIRNATSLIKYAGKTFLIDPAFANKTKELNIKQLYVPEDNSEVVFFNSTLCFFCSRV